MSRIFLSHSSKDNFEAIALRNWLATEGWNDVFLDLDPERGIAAGERWERSLHEAATRCEAVIFLVSGNWLGSGWCLKEYALARGLNKKLFAVLVDPSTTIDDLPPELKSTWQVVDLTGGQDMQFLRIPLPGSHEEKHVTFGKEGLRRLKLGLEKAGLDPKFFAWPPESERGRAPYRGLKPLEAVDAGIFFGREAPIIEAADRLRGLRAGAAPRLLVILGASGAGKSSFLLAGLLPRLARDDSAFLPLPMIRPERAALSGDSGLLASLAGAQPTRPRADLRAAIQSGAVGVRPLLAELVEASFKRTLASGETAKPPTIVIAIDQAEELFAAEGAAEGEALLRLIRDLTTEDQPAVIAIFAIRSDSYDALEHAKAFESLPQSTLPLLPMPRGAYKEVIEGPARRFVEAGGRLTIEPQLTQRLLEDIDKGSGSDALPLLAFTLEQLFLEYGGGGALTLANYETFGGIKGAIEAAVKRALAAADVDPRVPREAQSRLALLRRGLIPWLAGIDPDTGAPRRRVARLSEIPAEARPLVEHFIEQRLLATDVAKDTGEHTIEPAHEALLRQWGLLHSWLADDAGLLSVLEGVRRASRDWAANGRNAAWLSHSTSRLEAAEQLSARPDLAANLEPTDHAYLAASRKKEASARALARRVQSLIYTSFAIIIVGLVGWINQAIIKKQINWYMVMRPYLLAQVRPYVLTAEAERALKAGDSFRECAKDCPEMIVIPPGSFLMGSPATEKNHEANEDPQHEVTFTKPFAVSKYDVTFADWDVCVSVAVCRQVDDHGFGRDTRPVVNLNWFDAQKYVAWLSEMTGNTYRLLTEAEWEYAARAGTSTSHYWGNERGKGNANCKNCGSQWDGKETSPVGSFKPNDFGLYDMAGNVMEFVEDCSNYTYEGAPIDGSAWESGDCNTRVTRNGGWNVVGRNTRSAHRGFYGYYTQNGATGFRVARTIAP